MDFDLEREKKKARWRMENFRIYKETDIVAFILTHSNTTLHLLPTCDPATDTALAMTLEQWLNADYTEKKHLLNICIAEEDHKEAFSEMDEVAYDYILERIAVRVRIQFRRLSNEELYEFERIARGMYFPFMTDLAMKHIDRILENQATRWTSYPLTIVCTAKNAARSFIRNITGILNDDADNVYASQLSKAKTQ